MVIEDLRFYMEIMIPSMIGLLAYGSRRPGAHTSKTALQPRRVLGDSEL